MKFPKTLGSVSGKYESAGKGVDFVSNGSDWGDPGGDSYGVHQLSSAYSMGAFLRSKWGKPYAAKFKGMKPGSNSFNKRYKSVARADMEGFAYAQKAFYATTHYLPVKEHAQAKGFDVTDRGVQEALFSMSVQHGKAKLIVSEAARNGISSDTEKQVRSLFKERAEYVNGLRSLSRRIKSNIINNRYKNEVEDCVEWCGSTYEGDIQEPVEKSATLDIDVPDFGDGARNLLSIVRDATTGVISVTGALLAGAVSKAGEATSVISDEVLPDVDSSNDEMKDVPWMHTAKALMGTKEIRGRKHNSKIMRWAKDIGGWVASYYKNDEIPWCGLFVAHCMNANSIEIGFKNPLGARNWNKFGMKCEPQYGAVMVFSRKGGGHVGFYVSEDSKYYHILGGNQSNSVNTTKVAKNRYLGARWPTKYPTAQKQFAGRIKKKFDGKVSTNEA